MYGAISVDGKPPSQGPGGNVNLRHVTPDYFRALGIELLRGRPFTADVGVILSERPSRRLFPDQDPIGHTIQPKGFPNPYTVVGVGREECRAHRRRLCRSFTCRTTAPGAPRFVSAVVQSSAKRAMIARLMGDEIRAIDPACP
jgi:hypothetical protein